MEPNFTSKNALKKVFFECEGGEKQMARKPFGGMTIDFSTVKNITLGEVYGSGRLAPSECTKRFWVFVKKKGLMKK